MCMRARTQDRGPRSGSPASIPFLLHMHVSSFKPPKPTHHLLQKKPTVPTKPFYLDSSSSKAQPKPSPTATQGTTHLTGLFVLAFFLRFPLPPEPNARVRCTLLTSVNSWGSPQRKSNTRMRDGYFRSHACHAFFCFVKVWVGIMTPLSDCTFRHSFSARSRPTQRPVHEQLHDPHHSDKAGMACRPPQSKAIIQEVVSKKQNPGLARKQVIASCAAVQGGYRRKTVSPG